MADTTKGISTASRVRGSLLGLAVGDALGTTLENTKEITTVRSNPVELLVIHVQNVYHDD